VRLSEKNVERKIVLTDKSASVLSVTVFSKREREKERAGGRGR
jgi:hypothetical protein